MGIDHLRPFASKANPVVPMVFVGEASPWPSKVGDVNLFQRLDDVGSDSPRIGNGRTVIDKEPAVNTPSEVLGKVTVDVSADDVITEFRAGNDLVLSRLTPRR
jgi:hypothetical protein